MIDFKKKEINQLLVEVRNESENLLIKFGGHLAQHFNKLDVARAMISIANSQIITSKILLDLIEEKNESI